MQKVMLPYLHMGEISSTRVEVENKGPLLEVDINWTDLEEEKIK